ncbi:flagellar filament capping protein FliD [Paenibacillus sp. N1-5-1-14]|uniref:flagellar filament capping protein FliD n=1 Tax=Paenibacillus radicibacter TaxID=2972488 RepID=UPI002158B107|nr:flagellar filament capping protein FliD [Paenibacillus radicibacter]MCR8645035.1 flagellar filament capping protein FliD [Paenibacillus radicibacter]
MVDRIGGLASGINTDEEVQKLLKANRQPVNKLFQKKQTLQWAREDYRNINSKILEFHDSKLHKYRLQSTFAARTTSISGTDASSLSAKATGASFAGAITVTNTKIATPESMEGVLDLRTVSKDFNPNLPLASQLGNKPVDLSKEENRVFKINGKEVKFGEKESLNDVIRKINLTTDMNAAYNSLTGKLTLSSKTTGEKVPSEEMKLSGDFLTQTLGMSGTIKTGSNAEATINGVPMKQKSNTFNVNGTEITIKTNSTATTTINVTTDTDGIVNAVKDFVKDFNEMLKALQDKVGEAKYRDYKPLTDDQRKAMKEDEVKKWEEKARSGMLKNDDILSDAISKLRLSAVSSVSGGDPRYNTLSSIGISSGSYLDNGKLYVDEDKLRKAIEANPDAIAHIFAAPGDGGNDKSSSGLADRMYADMKNSLDKIKSRSGLSSVGIDASDESTIGLQLRRVKEDITAGNAKLKQAEDRYYRKFAAMEAAISKLNAQGSNLLSQFGG